MSTIERIRRKSRGNISYEYYGVNDWATRYDAKFIVENYDFLKSVFDEATAKTSIRHLDELRLYFLAQKYSSMAEVIPRLQEDEYKIIIRDVSSVCDEYIKKIGVKAIITYINTNYRRVFNASKREHELLDVILDFILEYGNGISETVWLFLADEYEYKLLYDYPKIKKRLCGEGYGPKMLDKMINIETPGHLWHSHLETIFSVLVDICLHHHTGELFRVAQRKVDQIYAVVNVLEKDDIAKRDLITMSYVYNDVLNFLKAIKDKRANDFAIKTKLLKNKLDAWLKENGETVGYKIPIGEMVEQWRKTKDWEVKLLSLTHDFVKKNDIAAMSRLAEYKKPKTILDHCSANFPTDDYFTYSRQLSLQIHANVGSGMILGILRNDEDAEEYYKLIMSAVNLFQNEVKAVPSESLLSDVKMLIDSVETIRHNKNKNESGDIRMLYYGASMLACAIAEKLLKITTEKEMFDVEYVQMNNLKLSSMLSSDNPRNPLIDIFGENHLKHLAFFLCTSGSNRVGRELRNDLAHLSDNIEEELNDQLLTQLLWILTDILNTIFWHYCLKNA